MVKVSVRGSGWCLGVWCLGFDLQGLVASGLDSLCQAKTMLNKIRCSCSAWGRPEAKSADSFLFTWVLALKGLRPPSFAQVSGSSPNPKP